VRGKGNGTPYTECAAWGRGGKKGGKDKPRGVDLKTGGRKKEKSKPLVKEGGRRSFKERGGGVQNRAVKPVEGKEKLPIKKMCNAKTMSTSGMRAQEAKRETRIGDGFHHPCVGNKSGGGEKTKGVATQNSRKKRGGRRSIECADIGPYF